MLKSVNHSKNRSVKNPISLEETVNLHKWLQGEEMEGYTFDAQPNLTPEEAFAVIYFLQEEMGLIPDSYEMCDECKSIYDSYEEGTHIDEEAEKTNGYKAGCYCDACRPD